MTWLHLIKKFMSKNFFKMHGRRSLRFSDIVRWSISNAIRDSRLHRQSRQSISRAVFAAGRVRKSNSRASSTFQHAPRSPPSLFHCPRSVFVKLSLILFRMSPVFWVSEWWSFYARAFEDLGYVSTIFLFEEQVLSSFFPKKKSGKFFYINGLEIWKNSHVQ